LRAAHWRCRQPTPHLVECAAMLYMFMVFPAAKKPPVGAMAATGGHFSVLALALALFMVAYVVRTGDHLTTSAERNAAQVHLAPRCAALCKIAMGLTMSYTLILML
jgi:hypothetical protein